MRYAKNQAVCRPQGWSCCLFDHERIGWKKFTLPLLIFALQRLVTAAEPDLSALARSEVELSLRTSQGVTAILVDKSPLDGKALKVVTEQGTSFLTLSPKLPAHTNLWLSFDVYYDSDHSGMLRLEFVAKNENSPRLTAKIGVFPRLVTRISFPFSYLDTQTVFMKRTPPRLKGVISGRRLPVEELAEIRLGLYYTADTQQLYINNITFTDHEPAYPVQERPLVDKLGQWKEKDWPGKTQDPEQLKAYLDREIEKLREATFPEGWSQFGGWKAKRFEATGFFRVHHDGQRWWLVDPDGYAFFSIGLDCVGTGESTPLLPGMEKLFEWLPPDSGLYTAAYSGRGPFRSFYPQRANLIRAWGSAWQENWKVLTVGRMRQWGFNTIGNWSDLKALKDARMPYVIQLGDYPATRTLLFRDFPDVFSPEFHEASRRYAAALRQFKDDPYLIGYFMRNEPLWAFGKYNLASEMLEANPGTATRVELARWLKTKYGTIENLNKAWNTQIASFDSLITERFHRLADRSATAAADLWEFSKLMARAYVMIPVQEARKIDPNHLNLGMRYAWISSELLLEAGQQFDVFSINCYQMEPCLDSVKQIAEATGKPVIIGEFHFGALDRGLPSTGLRAVVSQVERAKAYRRYVELAASDPNIVGVHYFTLNDQTVLGRFDGENYQIGFVDVCCRPYEELVEAARQTHLRLYEVRSGRLPPYSEPAQTRPAIAF